MNPLTDRGVLIEISRAWRESQADDPAQRHEEGGYILLNADHSYEVRRWPRGERSSIAPPSLDVSNRHEEKEVVATFHTHPNPPVDEVGANGSKTQAEAIDDGTHSESFEGS